MKLVLVISVVALCGIAQCDHLVVGNVADRVDLIHRTNIVYNAFPFMKRVKQYFFTSPTNQIIAGIQMLDNLHSKASVNITAGGVGYSYANFRLKSEKGRGLDYDLGIYAKPAF